MKHHKPDRFERMVSQYNNRELPDYQNCVLTDGEVVKMLRREHARTLRMVKQYKKNVFPANVGYIVDGLIRELQQRGK